MTGTSRGADGIKAKLKEIFKYEIDRQDASSSHPWRDAVAPMSPSPHIRVRALAGTKTR